MTDAEKIAKIQEQLDVLGDNPMVNYGKIIADDAEEKRRVKRMADTSKFCKDRLDMEYINMASWYVERNKSTLDKWYFEG